MRLQCVISYRYVMFFEFFMTTTGDGNCNCRFIGAMNAYERSIAIITEHLPVQTLSSKSSKTCANRTQKISLVEESLLPSLRKQRGCSSALRRRCWTTPRMSKRIRILTSAISLVLCVAPVSAKKTPEASSTVLKMHRLYTLQPPHDSSLYNILGVSPNATVADITKSYRKRSRELHPDKRKARRRDDNDNNDSDVDEELEKVREAYEVLKDDKTRLPYHRYGLMDTSDAALLLTGGRNTVSITKEQRQLLHIMGFGPKVHNPRKRHEQRVLFLAANLVEQMRPLVEGRLSEKQFADFIRSECDSLKKLPLGAQILRCVGRAYRYSGEKVLRAYHAKQHKHPIHSKTAALSDRAKDKIRNAKHLLTAAAVSGKLVLTEHVHASKKRKSNKKKENDVSAIGYHNEEHLLDELLGDDDVDRLDHCFSTDEEIRQQEQEKAQHAVIQALQVEALWKITKIDLDRTIQEACNMILNGKYFFFPSHQSKHKRDWNKGADGWVVGGGSRGRVIDAETGRLRAARALVLMGNIMVASSKQGTSWME